MSLTPFQSRLQDVVYNVDSGIGLRVIKMLIYVLFIVALTLVYQVARFKGLNDAEAMDYAQLARSIQETGHFNTRYIRPASIRYMLDSATASPRMMEEHPDIVHPPLYPALLAAAFALVKPSFEVSKLPEVYKPEQWVIVPLGHICTWLTGWLVYLIAGRLFDRRVAVFGVTLFFLSNAVWQMSISGLGISLATLLVCAAIHFLLMSLDRRDKNGPPLSWALPMALAAIFCALAFLTRYGTAVLVPGLALCIGWSIKDRGWRIALLFVLGFLICISPWLVRNKMVSGGFLGLAPSLAMNRDDAVVEYSFERSLHPDLKKEKVTSDLRMKWMQNMATLYNQNVRTVGDGLLTCLFLTAFFYRFARDPAHRLRWGLALAFAILVAIAAFFGEPTARLFHIFWPMIILYGSAFFFILLDRLQLRVLLYRYAVIAAMVLLHAAPLLFAVLPPRVGLRLPYPPYFPPYISHICRMLTPEELLCTDIPWASAWYGDRNSLLLPRTIDEFYEIHDKTKLVSGIYFTTVTRDLPYIRTLVTGEFRSWFPIQEGRIPGDFPLTQGFGLPVNAPYPDQLFLTDRTRWREKEM